MDKQTIYEGLIKNFIVKERRQRCLLELSNPDRRNEFINRLSHQTKKQFMMEKLMLIPKKVDLFQFIIDNLNLSKNESCYVISMVNELDDQFISFQEAFDKTYGIGFPSLVIPTTSDKIYLVEEQSFGPPNRYIGKA